MSGINTLVDTLMHQVLGKRVDTPLPRDLNQPIRPMTPSEAPRAVHSDSRLEQRVNLPLQETGRAARESARPTDARQPGGERSPPPSTQTNFTPTARSIADLLLRFPASPSALRLPQPLFAAGQATPATQVAEQLGHSIRDSGLFYESHLSRWFRGELSRAQLQREPQMWRPAMVGQAAQAAPLAALKSSLPALLLALSRGVEPSVGPGQGTGPMSAPAGQGIAQTTTPGAAGSPGTPAGPMPQANALAAALGPGGAVALREGATAAYQNANDDLVFQHARPDRGQPIHESLQGVVRHQLELLASPVLRWEGDVWSGLFMALLIQPPAAKREQGQGAEDEDGRNRRDPDEWHSSMILEVNGLGQVGVKLWLREPQVEIELSAADAEVRAALSDGLDRLRSRLEAHGLEEVHLRLSAKAPEPSADPEPAE